MEPVFGPDGSYGVFVRSDTNVEDLPGFTGAGLNKTIPNAVGFENLMAVNEGVGGAVDGQAAEALRINMKTGEVRRLAQATTPWRRVLNSSGGMDKELVKGGESVLSPDDIKQLINLAQDLPQRYPSILDADGNPAPADIEFGFVKGKLQLYQIRPLLESAQARGNEYLIDLDKEIMSQLNQTVKLDEKPGSE